MKTIEVELAARSYPILIGAGLLGYKAVLTPFVAGRTVMLITNATVAPLYLDRTLAALSAARSTARTILADGEAHKNLQSFEQIVDALLAARYGRDCLLVALGGGVIGDLAGFAAACYQRGVDFIQVPTTLLAQVDASVGGKTGVNHPRGKNMIGAFHQPRCVVADIETLTTLPPRELRAGLAEVIKYGVIGAPDFFAWLEANIDAVLALDPDAVSYAVEHSCRAKAAIVAADEREAGIRALLNLGHSFAHAIETGLGYGIWLHGEAVAAGMCMAADLARRLGRLDDRACERLGALLERAGLPVAAPASLESGRLLELMAIDKKNLGGQLRLVLPERIGAAVVSDDFDDRALFETLAEVRAPG